MSPIVRTALRQPVAWERRACLLVRGVRVDVMQPVLAPRLGRGSLYGMPLGLSLWAAVVVLVLLLAGCGR